MPTQSDIQEFTNKWYQPGYEHSICCNLSETKIRIFSPPYFLASKLKAYGIAIHLGDIYRKCTSNEQAFKQLALWYNKVEEASIRSFRYSSEV